MLGGGATTSIVCYECLPAAVLIRGGNICCLGFEVSGSIVEPVHDSVPREIW